MAESPHSEFNLPLRWLLLGLGLAPVVGAFFYNLGLRITPHKCFFQQTFGFPSPSCGMTRSFTAIARGDWQQALAYHLFSPLLFGVCVLVACHAAAEIVLAKPLASRDMRLLRRPAWIATGLLFLGYYALRMYARYGAGTLPFDLAKTLVWQQLTAGAKAL